MKYHCLILAGIIALTAVKVGAAARTGGDESGQRIALVTYAASEEQARSVMALVRSVRERGGICNSAPIYVISPDPGIIPADWLKREKVEIQPLNMEGAFLEYPLALKAFAAAQVEKKVGVGVDTLIWLDPGVLVLKSLEALDLGKDFDVAVRPVTLANTIGIPPGTEPNDYWGPIYQETGLDHAKLPALTTIADEQEIQPYYNCEVFSFNPKLGLAQEWARLLARFLKDDTYQKTVCTTFLRKLFLHQAVLSTVISSKIAPARIRALPLTCGYPFSQHDRLPAAKRIAALDEATVLIFDRTWQQDEKWLERIPAREPLRKWLGQIYRDYVHE